MLINGISLSSLGASLHDRILSSNKVKTVERWNQGSIEPTFIRQQDSFKSIVLKFLITDQNEENAFVTMSNITMLLKHAIIIFDDMPNLQFDVNLIGETEQERLKNGNFILTAKLQSDYAKGQSEIHTTNTIATDNFNLNIFYYKDENQLITNEVVKIKASDFEGKTNITFADLGINVNKYQEPYYNTGVVTNIGNVDLTYSVLNSLGFLTINYKPTDYYKNVEYYLWNGEGYDLITSDLIVFTHQQIENMTTIGQLIDLNKNRPVGYKATCKFDEEFTFDNLMSYATAIPVYYDIAENERVKDVTIKYIKETEGGNEVISTQVAAVRESDVVDGTVISSLIELNKYKPNDFYLDGYCQETDDNIIITFDSLLDTYNIYYTLKEEEIYVEYYKGVYPDWQKAYTDTLHIKYKPEYDETDDILSSLNINLNKYKNDYYEDGVIFNPNIYEDYSSIVNIKVIQVYYPPKQYTLTVQYKQNIEGDITLLGTRDYVLTDLLFSTEPKLANLIDINLYRPDGYKYNESESYNGEVSLSALTLASPISIVYDAVEVVRTKTVLVRYLKQLSNTFSLVNTNVVTVEEAEVGGGIKLGNLINVNKYKPDYYDNGIIDGHSADVVLTFDEINGTYEVYYFASNYSVQVRFYTDEVDTNNWVGSSQLHYTVLSFDTETSLASLGLNINEYKPPYCKDGYVLPFSGALTFNTLNNLEAINVIYESVEEPQDETGIDYPHRILFIHHNDLGAYEGTAPRTWTMNHAYINTGVVADDISKTTIEIGTLVMPDQNLIHANQGDAYLFGAKSPNGSLYMGYHNNKRYPFDNSHGKSSYYFAKAGYGVSEQHITEPNIEKNPVVENGFSRNTGIYASERMGYSYWTLTHSELIESDNGNTEVPIYLFACNNNGNYQGGIGSVGITHCRIYKNGVLVRDMIPVTYYDLIGDKVAPSDCLYDKVTQTFFEDARGLNSFNIIDDDEYEDKNLAHKIGKFYVNYYKNGGFFQSRTVYFRGSDLVDPAFDLDLLLEMDKYQPRFCGSGQASFTGSNYDVIPFDILNNLVINVEYPLTGYNITMNYYKDQVHSSSLLATEQVYISSEDFYQVPTFGQLFPLLKYKPEGYELKQENIPYTDTKVTLERIIQHAPYNIVYTPKADPQTYTIKVSYYKHKNVIDPRHPLNQYEYIGSQNITIDETQIIDGVYPETFMDFNLMKPEGEEAFWQDGQTFEWYTEDENLLTPNDLREEYIIVYEPIMQTVEIKYYTDEIDEDDFNLIATDSWSMKINDWDFGEQFQIVDELPNNYINKYKPITCNSGILQDPDRWYTFNSLVAQGHIDILYMTKIEPHDPDDDSYPDKVLFYYQPYNIQKRELANTQAGGSYFVGGDNWQFHNGASHPIPGTFAGLKIPQINLGYTPKEIGRLAIQTTAYSVADSCWDGGFGQNYGPITDAYTYFIGYMAGPTRAQILDSLGYDNGKDACFGRYGHTKNYNHYSTYSSGSKGWLAIRGHIPKATGFSKQYESIHSVDGNDGWQWSNAGQLFIRTSAAHLENNKELFGGFRLGAYSSIDENLNYYTENQDHYYDYRRVNSTSPAPREWNSGMWATRDHTACSFSNALDFKWAGTQGIDENGWPEGKTLRTLREWDPYANTYHNVTMPDDGDVYKANPLNSEYIWTEWRPATIFHPTTMLVDAFNKFIEVYDLSNDQNPIYYNIDTSNDLDLFTDRCKPKGPIRLFVTTNPETGQPNVIEDTIEVKPWTKNYKEKITSTSEYTKDEDEETEGGQQNQPGTSVGPEYESYGGLLEMAYNPYTTKDLNCPWIDFRFNAVPTPMRTMIWNVKIWDRGKLVRDLIPVEQGDQIFDYIAPFNGLFDKITEIFFTNENTGFSGYVLSSNGYGNTWEVPQGQNQYLAIGANEVYPLHVKLDPTTYGKVIVNYYDWDNTFLGNKWVRVPTDYFPTNIEFKDLMAYNDMKPSEFYHDGMLDTDTGLEIDTPLRTRFKQIYDAGAINIYYKQKQYTKTVVYYNENTRIASKDFFFSQHEIEEANTLEDLGVDPELYRTNEFGPGVVMSDETIIASDDIAAFIDAPSPIVVYHKYTKEERPDLLYVEYYRGGAYEPEGEESIVLNSENKNYLDCDLSAVVLNPKGLTKYSGHYHSALYEDEDMPYFLSYQVDVVANYVPIHKGPARAYTLLAHITDRGRYTVIEERNGWGRLKEYPKGWILLNYTAPVTGPGQNPNYDTPLDISVGIVGQPNSAVPIVTIPFGTKMSITKMTIDRLWAYTPDYDSWIKTEEISFDQQGRLYSALAMKVLHLDRLDWSNISSLEDMGINVQQYKLRFHDNSSFVYNGAFTQEAFSNLHSIDIVYPETIYPYVVKYYKNTVDENNVIGRGGFSCTISDWNPDWDTFLSTSWLSGCDATTTENTAMYRTVGKTETISVPKDELVYVLEQNVQFNGTNNYHYVMWNGYIGYIYNTNLDITDYQVHTISPILYRSGVPIMLTWDYYNLDRNLYKPDHTYTDGIMLWNPHTYDNKILNFSFEELVTTGGQKVLYVPKVDVSYKARFNRGWYKLPIGIENFYYIPTNENPGTWDIEIKWKPKNMYGTWSACTTQYIFPNRVYGYNRSNADHQDIGTTFYTTNDGLIAKGPDYIRYDNPTYTKQIMIGDIFTYRTGQMTSDGYGVHKYYEPKYIDGDTVDTYYNIVNFSNKRNWDKAIAQIYGTYSWESQTIFTPRAKQLETYQDTSNYDYDKQNELFSMDYINIGAGTPYRSTAASDNYAFHLNQCQDCDYWYIKVWHNFELTHYWVPMAQGYWMPNGTQAPNNCFYDLITQITSDTFAEYPDNVDGQDRPNILKDTLYEEYYNYFDGWQFEVQEANYTIKTLEALTVYEQPDVLARQVGNVDKNTVIPIRTYTDDTENHVLGTWYNINSGWIQADKCSIISYEDPITELRKTVALKGDVSNTSKQYYGYIRPNDEIIESIDGTYWYMKYMTGNSGDANGYIQTPYSFADVSKIELDIGGRLAPDDTSALDNSVAGILFGNYWLQYKASYLNASTTQDERFTIIATKGTNNTWTVGTGTNILTFNNVYSTGSNLPPILIGAPGAYYTKYTNQDATSKKRYFGQKAAKYYSVKMWDNNNNLIYSIKPKLVLYNADTYLVKLYEEVSGTWINFAQYENAKWFAGDTSPADGLSDVKSTNTFTTERTDRVYFACNDFYWNGIIWIPASYTDDYKVMWENSKIYIAKTANIYDYNYPLQESYYRVNNYLAGDRLTAVGHLGKDPNWYLLDNGKWVFQNDTFTELEV